jgi:putative copper export protein
MPPIAYSIILFLHILSMAMWFGGSFGLGTDLRKTLARGKPHTELWPNRMNGAMRRASVAALLTFVTGMVLILSRGFANVDKRYHIGLAITLVALGLQFVFLLPFGSAVERAISKGEGKELNEQSKRLSMLTGVLHLLLTIVLLLMVVPIGI